jgi:hypothetical protein
MAFPFPPKSLRTGSSVLECKLVTSEWTGQQAELLARRTASAFFCGMCIHHGFNELGIAKRPGRSRLTHSDSNGWEPGCVETEHATWLACFPSEGPSGSSAWCEAMDTVLSVGMHPVHAGRVGLVSQAARTWSQAENQPGFRLHPWSPKSVGLWWRSCSETHRSPRGFQPLVDLALKTTGRSRRR